MAAHPGRDAAHGAESQPAGADEAAHEVAQPAEPVAAGEASA